MSLHDLAGFHSRGELHRVISPQPVTLGQLDGSVDDRTIYGKKDEVVLAIFAGNGSTRDFAVPERFL